MRPGSLCATLIQAIFPPHLSATCVLLHRRTSSGRDFAELPEIDIDTAAVARDWNAARDSVLEQLRAKAAAPLEPMALTPEAIQAIQNYRKHIAYVAALAERLVGANERLDIGQRTSRGRRPCCPEHRPRQAAIAESASRSLSGAALRCLLG